MNEFDEGKRKGLPGTPTIVNALGGEFAGALGQEVHGDGVHELLSAGATDAVSKHGVGLAHVTHDHRHAERTNGRKGRSAECVIGSSLPTGDAKDDGRWAEALDGTSDEACEFSRGAGCDTRGLPTPRSETEAVENALTGAASMKLKRENTRRRHGGFAHSDESSRA